MSAFNTDSRSTTDGQMMITAKQIAPRPYVICPADRLGLGMA
jgi:hypothetical protein